MQSAQKENGRRRTELGKPLWRVVRRKSLSKKPEGSLEKVMNQKQAKTNEYVALWMQASSPRSARTHCILFIVSLFTCSDHGIGHPRAVILSPLHLSIARGLYGTCHREIASPDLLQVFFEYLRAMNSSENPLSLARFCYDGHQGI